MNKTYKNHFINLIVKKYNLKIIKETSLFTAWITLKVFTENCITLARFNDTQLKLQCHGTTIYWRLLKQFI